jgi:hypothetical protein
LSRLEVVSEWKTAKAACLTCHWAYWMFLSPGRCYRKEFPAIGLFHFPPFAAFISAYNAGLMPFFLHLFISASLRVDMSKLLALHPLLELDRLCVVSQSPDFIEGRSDEGDPIELAKSE